MPPEPPTYEEEYEMIKKKKKSQKKENSQGEGSSTRISSRPSCMKSARRLWRQSRQKRDVMWKSIWLLIRVKQLEDEAREKDVRTSKSAKCV